MLCRGSSWYSCSRRCTKEWDLGPTEARLQCFCDSFCEMSRDCCEDYDKYCLPSDSLTVESTTPSSSMFKPRATLSLMKGTDLFTSHNVTIQVLTSSLIMNSLHITQSPPYKQIRSHSTIKATTLSSFPKEEPPSAPDERWKCVQDGHTNETIGLWMIAACPKQWPADLTKKKCEQPYNLSAENLNDMIPVYDQKENRYRNHHCARCDQVMRDAIRSPLREMRENLCP